MTLGDVMRYAATREPTWVDCVDCGTTTAAAAVGPTRCLECSVRKRRRTDALDQWHPPVAFEWARMSSVLEGRVSPRAITEATMALGRSSPRVAIIGPSGSGKTSLAVAMGRQWCETKCEAPVFASAIRLGAARMRAHSEVDVDIALHAPLLILDDVGSEREVPSSPIVEILHERHAENKPTWVTTWMDSKQLEARYGQGITRRMLERAAIIDCGAA